MCNRWNLSGGDIGVFLHVDADTVFLKSCVMGAFALIVGNVQNYPEQEMNIFSTCIIYVAKKYVDSSISRHG